MKLKIKIITIMTTLLLIGNVFATDAEKEVYRVGYSTDSQPVQYMGKDQEATGIIIDLLAEIGKIADIEFEYIPIQKDSKQDYSSILDMSIVYESQLSEKLDFEVKSNTLFKAPLTMIADSSVKQNSSVNVGVIGYTNLSVEDMYGIMPNALIYTYNDPSELYHDLSHGKIDCILVDTYTAESILANNNGDEYTATAVSESIPIFLYLSNDLPVELIKIINEALLEISFDTAYEIAIKHDSDYSNDLMGDFIHNEQTQVTSLQHMMLLIIAVSMLVIVVIVILAGLYRMHLNKITYVDSVTGFLTEYRFNIEVIDILRNAEPNTYTLVSLDIDKFQYINDLYSYEFGTTVLQSFATFIKESYPTGLCFARTHSDNFLVFLKDFDPNDPLASRNFVFDEPTEFTVDKDLITTSRGIYQIDQPELRLTELVGNVNYAKARGKSIYGNTTVQFTQAMRDERSTQNKILASLDYALAHHEFEIFYQPKINLQTRLLHGAEALVRWHPKDGSQVFPDQFISLFEKNRCINRLDYYVFDGVCEFLDKKREHFDGLKISVNLSTVTMADPDLVERLFASVEKYNVDPNLIEVEITEGAFVENLADLLIKISNLQRRGFVISLDDFGSGISSLNQLQNMDIDILKLDKGFLADSLNRNKGKIIVESVINLAKELDLLTVAEGVESAEHVNLLTELGCDIVQGFYFSRPLPDHTFLDYIDDKSPRY